MVLIQLGPRSLVTRAGASATTTRCTPAARWGSTREERRETAATVGFVKWAAARC
jgi:hypothetical protein